MRRWWWLRVLGVLACLLTVGGGVSGPVAASGEWQWLGLKGATPVLYADDREVQTYLAPPQKATELRAQAATITVQYEGFPPEAQASFQHAVNIWQTLLDAPVPIRIRATWTPLDRGILGGAGPYGLYRNTSSNAWYPTALAKQLMNRDPRPNEPDVIAQFSSSGIPWYFGTGQPRRGNTTSPRSSSTSSPMAWGSPIASTSTPASAAGGPTATR